MRQMKCTGNFSGAQIRLVNDLQDKPEGLDVSVLPTGSVAGSPVALHPYG